MLAKRVTIEPAAVDRLVEGLADHGRHGATGVWRQVYTPPWQAAQDALAAEFAAAGLAVERDAVGNVWGVLAGSDGGKLIVTGSHVDSQCPGGRFDGVLGIIAGFLAVTALKERFGPPRRPLAVVSLAEEEASRFAAGNFWGSRAIIGRIGPDEPATLLDFDGVPMATAMREAGLDPGQIPTTARDDIAAFIELHIEQGPLLEQTGYQVGIVERIVGYRQYVLELRGEANHAGTTPMDLRRDPMAGAAEIISGVINTAHRMGRPAVTTVGRILAEPNGRAVIPAVVRFTVDARHPEPAGLALLCERHERLFAEVAARRDLELAIRLDSDRAPCPSDPELVAAAQRAAAEAGVPALTMPSGAVHDAMQMAAIAPIVMIFVPSHRGLSHTPAEFTATADIVAGIEVLAHTLHQLAY
jgi:allantoate deiminase